MPFPGCIDNLLCKVRSTSKGARRHNYLQFPVSKGRVKAISDISTFCGKYLLTSIYPKNVALAKKLLQFPLSSTWHCKENNFTMFMPLLLHFIRKTGKFVDSHTMCIFIDVNIREMFHIFFAGAWGCSAAIKKEGGGSQILSKSVLSSKENNTILGWDQMLN